MESHVLKFPLFQIFGRIVNRIHDGYVRWTAEDDARLQLLSEGYDIHEHAVVPAVSDTYSGVGVHYFPLSYKTPQGEIIDTATFADLVAARAEQIVAPKLWRKASPA